MDTVARSRNEKAKRSKNEGKTKEKREKNEGKTMEKGTTFKGGYPDITLFLLPSFSRIQTVPFFKIIKDWNVLLFEISLKTETDFRLWIFLHVACRIDGRMDRRTATSNRNSIQYFLARESN